MVWWKGKPVQLQGARTRWWWVRHARVPVAGRIVYGRADVPCDTSDTATLAAQARVLPADAVVVTSGLARAEKTLAALGDAGYAYDPAGVLREPDLEERRFGAWEGLSWDEIESRWPGVTAEFWKNPFTYAPPGGEDHDAHTARVHAAVARLTERFPGRDIVSVGHAGSIRAELTAILALSHQAAAAIDLDFLSLTRIDYYHGELKGIARIVAVNGFHGS